MPGWGGCVRVGADRVEGGNLGRKERERGEDRMVEREHGGQAHGDAVRIGASAYGRPASKQRGRPAGSEGATRRMPPLRRRGPTPAPGRDPVGGGGLPRAGDLPGPVRVRALAGPRRGRLRLRMDRRRVRRGEPAAGRPGRGHPTPARRGACAGRSRSSTRPAPGGRTAATSPSSPRPTGPRGSGRGTSAPAASTSASRRIPETWSWRRRTPARSSARTSPRT